LYGFILQIISHLKPHTSIAWVLFIVLDVSNGEVVREPLRECGTPRKAFEFVATKVTPRPELDWVVLVIYKSIWHRGTSFL
jgi:hypothetical protein